MNLNGSGGEIYRCFWKLPSKKLKIEDFVKAKYDDFETNIATNIFMKSTFLKTFGEKIIYNLDLGTKNSKLSYPLINLIYPNFRLRYWAARMCSRTNQFCYALQPFTEPLFYLKSAYLPISYKIAGKFESALIKKINPELAKINSNYKFNFYNGPNLNSIAKEWIKIHTPLNIRLLLRKKNNIRLTPSNLDSLKKSGDLIFNKKKLIEEYINLDNVSTKEMYSRALTIEYYLQNYL